MGILKNNRRYGKTPGDHKMLMKKTYIILFVQIILFFSIYAYAGPYAPAAGQEGSTAIYMDDDSFISWATDWENYIVGTNVDEQWQTPEKALGAAIGTSGDIVCLGRGGNITMTFDTAVKNGEGNDFAIFENSFSDTFLELAYVEVSTDGINFVGFDNDSMTLEPVTGFGTIDPTDITGFAGKYRQGYGTPFDLQDLAGRQEVLDDSVNLANINYIRLIDITGDGTCFDTSGDVIFDPYPTTGSAGFDLDAIGVINERGPNVPPDTPELLYPVEEADIPLTISLITDSFSDYDTAYEDFHYRTRWQISLDADFSEFQLVSDIISVGSLTSLYFTGATLLPDQRYYWRVKFYDSSNEASQWSNVSWFETVLVTNDDNSNGIHDDYELESSSCIDLNNDNIYDVDQIDNHFKVFNAAGDNVGQIAVSTNNDNVDIEYVEPVGFDDISDELSKPDDMLLGLISFRLKVQNPGESANIKIFFSESVPENYRWYKYDSVQGWYVYPDAIFSQDRRSVTLTLVDGSTGDGDGLENGIIIDPGGVGGMESESVSAPPGGSSGIGGSGGCFIKTVSFWGN